MLQSVKRTISRFMDFMPIIGPLLMITWFILGFDIISKTPFDRLSFRWLWFLGSAISTFIVNVFFFGELLDVAGYITFPFSFAKSIIVIPMLAIVWYLCHAMFLWIDLFQATEWWLLKHFAFVRWLKRKEDGLKKTTKTKS